VLTQLSVRNFVLIESLDLELGRGLNVLSGGSGEGKTLLLNALRFVLGQGANGKAAAARWVRAGAAQAKVRVVFECPEGKQILERSLSAAGRGRCSLIRVGTAGIRAGNEAVLPLPAYRARASRLGEFFGQGQAQRLVEPDAQRELLDSVAGTRDLLQRYSSERDELLTRARTHDRLAREELALRDDWSEQQAQRDALGALAPEQGEFEELIAGVDRLEAQADQASALAALARDLEGDESGYGDEEGLADAVGNASATLAGLQAAWPELAPAHESLLQAAELLQEASRGVASVRASAGFDPHELDSLRRRESEFRSLGRRLGLRPQDLAARWQRLRTLDPEAIAAERAALALRLRRGRKRLDSLGAELSAARRAAAETLTGSVLKRLPELGLGEARFEVKVLEAVRALTNPLSPEALVGPTSEAATCSAAASEPRPQASSPRASSAPHLSPGAGGGSRDGAPGSWDPSRGSGIHGLGESCASLERELLTDHPSHHGGDLVELRFSANPALPLGGLDQASGGELGRVFLALGLEAPANAALLVFDEVDQNVGARLGTAVGACLERMSHSRQVLAITHLAPVAARARLHHRISKRAGVTRVETLEGEDRVDELALMIRGEPLTEASRTQARELLSEAQESAAQLAISANEVEKTKKGGRAPAKKTRKAPSKRGAKSAPAKPKSKPRKKARVQRTGAA
jgi:DNA repair protein RecN (Recombination protein N)